MARLHSFSPGPTRAERAVLEEVRRRTGIDAPKLGWFATTDEGVAKAILPVLAEWLERSSPSIRGAIYSLFAIPYARDWIDLLISYWPKSVEPVELSILVSALCATVQDAEARRILDLMLHNREKLEDFRLLAKLSEFPSTARSVRDYVVKALEEREFRAGDLLDISKVRDPRIAEQMGRREHSEDPAVRRVARRFAARSDRLPSGVRRMTSTPDRGSELFSTEVDMDDLGRLVQDLARKFGLRLSSSPLKNATDIILGAPLDTWLAVSLKGQSGQMVTIWLRLEDVDTVEVVATAELPTPG
jgi:hypothetical protein